jgi:signal transduction histidine kinase
MNRPSNKLEDRFRASHLLVALSGAVAFLLVGVVLAFSLPTPAPADVTPRQLVVAIASAAVGLAVSGLVGVAASGRLYTRIADSLTRMTDMARRIAKGNYSERVSGGEEIAAKAPDAVVEAESADTGVGEDVGDATGALATALDQLAATLEAAEHRRTISFGEVVHEIRTPVAVLEGYLEGLLDGHVKPSDKTWAMLFDEASRVHRLVDELQALSSAESRNTAPELQAVDPAAVAGGALERLRLHFQEKGLEVRTEIAPSLPLVLADPDQALQALVNLLTNALRYTPAQGQVTLSVSCLTGTSEVLFSVTDTGVGIAAEHIPHLFERFFRIDRGGSGKVGGSGIGLPVAKALVEAMGGRIWAESAGLGKGSTFSFTLLSAVPRRSA